MKLLAVIILVLGSITTVMAEEGTLQVLHQDKLGGKSEHVFTLKTASGSTVLKNVKNPHDWLTGDKVRVSGTKVKGTLNVTSMEALALASLPNTIGPHKTIVLLVNFRNNTTQPFTPEQIASSLTTASNFLRQNSFGQSWLDPIEVYGWFTSPDMDATDCTAAIIASNEADQAVGVNLADYDHVIHVFPWVNCGFTGAAEIGGRVVYLNNNITPGVVSHELGHNYGLYHSHSLACANNSCLSNDVGDIYDTMGALVGHFNAPQKERLGWLSLIDQNYVRPERPRAKRLRGQIPPLVNVTAPDGLHIIAPYELQNLDVKALKVGNYYLENRSVGGLIVHLSQGTNQDYLLDLDGGVVEDWVLDVGQIFTDGVVTITPISVNSKGATVHVEK
jgi:Gametolysin peptidase M11